VTSGPPALPGAGGLSPREQVAVNLVAAGVEAMDKEDVARARTLFERAIEIAPLQPYSYYFLGKLALNHGEHQKALPLLRKADILLIRGDQAWRSEAISAQGAVHEDLGELPQARRAYRKSLQLFPQNLRAMSALARLAE
jgi:Flp pilus assembly protein TadD